MTFTRLIAFALISVAFAASQAHGQGGTATIVKGPTWDYQGTGKKNTVTFDVSWKVNAGYEAVSLTAELVNVKKEGEKWVEYGQKQAQTRNVTGTSGTESFKFEFKNSGLMRVNVHLKTKKDGNGIVDPTASPVFLLDNGKVHQHDPPAKK